ncbi:CBS domain-containing protein [Streptomyces muensis]|uniref:CBS domain-containing protein n=1 Tax=Streptomyces muensis TaxID=1077944 RepID=A0A9X1PZL9_STRM4|nr:CBS domain-containing protein [Streptomyces muensis]MCF1595876.1 CBS domain-containing protein [Streptomyces muensis]
MKHHKVGSVMTTDVVRVSYGTPFKEVARLLADHGISGLLVVDEDGMVIGVISETDLVARQAATPGPYEPRRRSAFLSGLTRGARRQAAKVHARTAGRLTSTPPVTAHADDTIVEAARTMAQHQVERLPVLDEADRLVGIVPRRDLLQVFLRPDKEGVVTLTGHMERKSETQIALSMTARIDGVVGVVDRLTYRLDDARLQTQEQALHGVADDWLRRL